MDLSPPVVIVPSALCAVVSAAMVATGFRRHADSERAGWWLLIASLLLFGLVRSADAAMATGLLPTGLRLPAWAAMLAATVTGTVGIARVAVRRLSSTQRSITVDALVVAVAASLAFWHTSVAVRQLPGPELALSVATLVLQAAVATFFLRLLFAAPHLASARWLAAAGGMTAAGAFLMHAGAAGVTALVAELLWSASLLSVGRAALQPDMRELGNAETDMRHPGLSERLRVRLLAFAPLAGPGAALVLAQDDVRVGLLLALVMGALSAGFAWRVERLLDDRRTAELRLEYRATHDALTGLANRHHLLDQLTAELAGPGGSHVAVALIDLDDFKLVNDGMGHAVGDRLLELLAVRLQRVLRDGDTVARLGGDEFAVVWPGTTSADQALELATRIADHLNGEYTVGDVRMHVGASVGVAWSDHGELGAQHLLSHADVAMYAAKQRTDTTVVLYEASMSAHSAARLEIATRLWSAAAAGELRLLYQPEVDIDSGKGLSAEALVRWEHPQLGLLGPGQFLDIAEQTGSIVAIGEWVLREACRQAAQWHRDHPGQAPRSISVNVAPRQLVDPSFLDTVRAALAATGLDPGVLWLEVTETSVMTDPDSVARLLQDLKSLGVGIAIDDFGTGYSSMAHLRRFPIDALKIDRSFVMNLEHDERDFSIVEGVIGLARGLQLTTIAEGIETEQQLALLGSLGCDVAQGYLFSKPLPADAFTEWMLQRGTDRRLAAAV